MPSKRNKQRTKKMNSWLLNIGDLELKNKSPHIDQKKKLEEKNQKTKLRSSVSEKYQEGRTGKMGGQ